MSCDARDKRRALRALLEGSRTEFLLEAHSGVSARIAEEAGFRGIWASGLAISAQCGVRDNNELSWTQIVDVVELMADATTIPILVDGDTGHGDFNNVRRLVRKLEQRGAAGVCLEDKVFPKANSFIDGRRQPLEAVDVFCGKLAAGKDSARDPDFCVVARVEALIAGWGIDEALMRAEAYRAAGADAVLVHSQRSDAREILEFARAWRGRLPLVIVPTKYSRTPTEEFRSAGVRLVIWANPLLRAAVAAMQETARALYETETLTAVESRISPLEEVFRLQRTDELRAAEHRYGASRAAPTVLVLPATDRLLPEPEARPPDRAPMPLRRALVEALKRESLHEIVQLEGEKRDGAGAHGELVALASAHGALGRDSVLLYDDLLFRRYILQGLLEAPGPLCAVVDSAPIDVCSEQRAAFAYCSAADDGGLHPQPVLLHHVSHAHRWNDQAPSGRWIGMLRARDEGAVWLRAVLARLERRLDFGSLGLFDLLNALCDAGHPIRVHYVHGHWLRSDTSEDLEPERESVHVRQ